MSVCSSSKGVDVALRRRLLISLNAGRKEREEKKEKEVRQKKLNGRPLAWTYLSLLKSLKVQSL